LRVNVTRMNSPNSIKIIIVVGARPNFMKVAPILRAIVEHNAKGRKPFFERLLVHTGQHYDELMSDRFFRDLGLPDPDVHLGVGSAQRGNQTAETLERFTGVLEQEMPDVVVVVGDVNSTLACALATAKVPVHAGVRRPVLAHVEAGLRSFDREMPEEINRIVTDQLADLLFVTETSGLENLRKEGVPRVNTFFVGNTMIDSLLAFEPHADNSMILEKLELDRKASSASEQSRPFALLTLHRPSNVDDPKTLRRILQGLSELSRKMEIIFPVHPRTRKRLEAFGDEFQFLHDEAKDKKGIRLIEPLGYLDFLCVMKNAHLILTDSGGVQEESTCLGVPCVTIRNNTERPVTVKHGTNVIAGTSVPGIRRSIARQLSRKVQACVPEKWDGKAAERIVKILAKTVRPVGRVMDGPMPQEPVAVR
jgi:UDP-N-acetylglucosamine 2-epimerase (non-hydrolysing)